MKDIITDTSMTETRSMAVAKWREYTAASKTFKLPVYQDLQKVYNQVKGGRKVIDVGKVITKGGIHPDGTPKLAITLVTAKKVFCTYKKNGDVIFKSNDNLRERLQVNNVDLPGCLPAYKTNDWRGEKNLEAPVPPVPPRFMPKKLTNDYYILWEVDEWKMIPPTDPYLLRRITRTMFVVIAGWDLTDIEKSAMAGRMY